MTEGVGEERWIEVKWIDNQYDIYHNMKNIYISIYSSSESLSSSSEFCVPNE